MDWNRKPTQDLKVSVGKCLKDMRWEEEWLNNYLEDCKSEWDREIGVHSWIAPKAILVQVMNT